MVRQIGVPDGGRQASGGWGFIILFALVEVEVMVVMVEVLGKAGCALQLALRASCSGLSLTRPE